MSIKVNCKWQAKCRGTRGSGCDFTYDGDALSEVLHFSSKHIEGFYRDGGLEDEHPGHEVEVNQVFVVKDEW